SWDIGQGISIGVLPLMQFVAAVVVIGGLQALFYRTAFGRAFRATSDDPSVAQLMGLDNRHVFALAMALSLAVVAIAGVLLAVSAAACPVRFRGRRCGVGLASFATLVAALAFAPWWAGRDDLHLLGEFFAYVALASLWNLLAGYAGLVSVGQQAYVGLGGYMLFASTIEAGVHPLLAVPVAGAVAAVVALPVAGLMFRLRGHYFAIGPWVVAEVFLLIA